MLIALHTPSLFLVGIFDNRVRPHQYSKPGPAGMGAGVTE